MNATHTHSLTRSLAQSTAWLETLVIATTKAHNRHDNLRAHTQQQKETNKAKNKKLNWETRHLATHIFNETILANGCGDVRNQRKNFHRTQKFISYFSCMGSLSLSLRVLLQSILADFVFFHFRCEANRCAPFVFMKNSFRLFIIELNNRPFSEHTHRHGPRCEHQAHLPMHGTHIRTSGIAFVFGFLYTRIVFGFLCAREWRTARQ